MIYIEFNSCLGVWGWLVIFYYFKVQHWQFQWTTQQSVNYIYLSKDALKASITTSNSSEINVLVAGAESDSG